MTTISSNQNADLLGDDADLISDSNNISPLKIAGLVAIILLLIGALVFAVYLFFKENFGFLTENKTDTAPIIRSFQSAPSDIGTPPPPIETTGIVNGESAEKVVKITSPDFEVSTPPKPLNAPPPETVTALTKRRLESTIRSSTGAEPSSKKGEVQAVKIIKNMSYMLLEGTRISCTLITSIVTELEGDTSCVVNQDVYSGNQRMLLIEKGSTVFGSYETGLLNGQTRLGVIWHRIITPYDVGIKIKAPSSGRLGTSGLTGKVDNRWFKRIGSALLISLFDDAIKIAANRADKGSDADVILSSNTTSSTQEIAGKVLDKNIDLPPIFYKSQGEILTIRVKSDIDLSSVYGVIH
jgi:type IV secretion system protein VirB10